MTKSNLSPEVVIPRLLRKLGLGLDNGHESWYNLSRHSLNE